MRWPAAPSLVTCWYFPDHLLKLSSNENQFMWHFLESSYPRLPTEAGRCREMMFNFSLHNLLTFSRAARRYKAWRGFRYWAMFRLIGQRKSTQQQQQLTADRHQTIETRPRGTESFESSQQRANFPHDSRNIVTYRSGSIPSGGFCDAWLNLLPSSGTHQLVAVIACPEQCYVERKK